MAPRAGLEPATDRLTADCSTTELSRKTRSEELMCCVVRPHPGGLGTCAAHLTWPIIGSSAALFQRFRFFSISRTKMLESTRDHIAHRLRPTSQSRTRHLQQEHWPEQPFPRSSRHPHVLASSCSACRLIHHIRARGIAIRNRMVPKISR